LTIATVRTSNPTKSNQIRIATQQEKHSNIDKGEKDEEKRDMIIIIIIIIIIIFIDCD